MSDPNRQGPSGALVDVLRGARATPATFTLCATAVVLSIAGWTSPGLEAFVLDQSAFGSEPWRLITAHLVHGNFLHLYFNLTCVWFLGRAIELRLSAAMLLGSTIFLMLGGSAAMHAFDRGGIGISGVVYGMWAMLYTGSRGCYRLRGVLTPRINKIMVGWFFFCILATWQGWLPISNWGHGSGAVLGALAGFAITQEGRFRIGALPFGAALLALLAAGATVWWPKWNFGGAAIFFEEQADAALDRSDWEEGVRLLRAAVDLDSTDGRDWWNLGVALVKLEREAEALDSFYRSFECGGLDHERLDALHALLAAQLARETQQSQTKAALQTASRVVAVDPDDRHAWEALEKLAALLGDAQETERAKKELARLDQKP
ncbi:MAG: rhomboid family intramembrane serine protease [Planctomycetes bacterium]|nr:rhomboid family intramembrane serine protease [Planctomycetota bacterium]